jgi:RNA polymerase sigma-70 factor (ECF subfamily)
MENNENGRGFSEANMKDLEVLERIKAGDDKAFRAIYVKYAPWVRQFIYLRVHNPKMAEDILQDIMSKVWSSLDKYKVDRTFNSWLWRIVKNHMVDHYRKSAHTVLNTATNVGISCEDLDIDSAREQNVVFENTIEDRSRTADKRINERDVARFVGSILGSVSERERRVLEMYFFEEMSYTEIAEELNIPLNTMKVILLRVKEKIRSRTGALETAKALLA